MKLNSGDLYFVREQDVLTGEESEFCKIGLVGDERTGGVDKRVKEHQTGNPRRLVSVANVPSPAIEDLETSVHKRFAIDRIRGEWFQLDATRLRQVIDVARTLAAEQSDHADVAMTVNELDREVSSGSVRSATSTEVELHRRLLEYKVLSSRASDLGKRVDRIFREAFDNDRPVRQFVTFTTRKNANFDKAKFGESHPDLLAQYTHVQSQWSHTFSPKLPKALLAGIEPDAEFLDLERRMNDLFEVAATDADRLVDLHMLHLELIRFEAQVGWDDDLCRLTLKAECGLDDGIEGIAMWKREMKESPKFDETLFKNEHPDLHAQFVVETETGAFSVVSARSYRLPGI